MLLEGATWTSPIGAERLRGDEHFSALDRRTILGPIRGLHGKRLQRRSLEQPPGAGQQRFQGVAEVEQLQPRLLVSGCSRRKQGLESEARLAYTGLNPLRPPLGCLLVGGLDQPQHVSRGPGRRRQRSWTRHLARQLYAV